MKKHNIFIALLLIGASVVQISAATAITYEEDGTVYEAENALLENVEVVQEFYEGGEVRSFSGSGFVGQFDNTDDNPSALTFTIDVPEDGRYDLMFYTCSPFDKKYNSIKIDDNEIMHEALESPKSTEFHRKTIEADLTAGEHAIKILEGWGFMYVDALAVRKQVPQIPPLNVSSPPVNANSTAEAVALKSYLNECYGSVILSGQYAEGIDSPEISAIFSQTGKYPAIMGFDFIYYGKSASENVNFEVNTTQLAIDWWNKGGIVTFCWHWFAPKDNLLSSDQPWNKSFYTSATDFNLAKAMDGSDPEGYDMLCADIDAVSAELAILQEAGVPVLWRPLHEASGG